MFRYLFWSGVGHEQELLLQVPPTREQHQGRQEQEHLEQGVGNP